MSNFIDLNTIESVYKNAKDSINNFRKKNNRPLTLTEKILINHLYNKDQKFDCEKRGESDLELAPDRVCMQDATAQMAILQFISVGVPNVATPTSVHCDHLIRAKEGSKKDLSNAKSVNKEVYDFISSSAKKYGMDFWKPGSGIIHQIVLENYAFPGGMIIGTDSHTPTAGGLGMIAIGVGGADAVDVMTKQPWNLKNPKITGVHLKGKMSGWTSPKDIILYLCGKLTVKGGTGKVIEYFGEGAESISCTGKSTITNMGAELGATTSIFAYDKNMEDYLRATNRSEVADLANKNLDILKADDKVIQNPEKYYDEVVEIDLSKLEPAINGPHTPDAYHPISKIKSEYKEIGIPEEVSACLIGSCTNSSYEDISRAVFIAKKAKEKGLKLKTKLFISPGSNQIEETMERDGFKDVFESIGGVILSNSCGPCIGQWDRGKIQPDKKSVIVNSFNRNFKKRNDGRENTFAFVASPEMVMAIAFSGKANFNPITDTIKNENNEDVKLEIAPQNALPKDGFKNSDLGCDISTGGDQNIGIIVDPNSERIQILQAFKKWDFQNDFKDNLLLLKSKGKCTTDHVSPAGPWLKFRGHLDNISKNIYSGAVNFFTNQTGLGKNILTGEEQEFNQIARYYKEKGKNWIVIGDENYGEGSSREHAAMEPRFLGVTAVICKSFARIAETNLKKQGVLPLVFKNPNDYDKFLENDTIDILNVDKIQPNSIIKVKITHKDKTEEIIDTIHSFNEEEIEWLKAGSALNRAGDLLKK